MAQILPKYEVLQEDLESHHIENYLISREFKNMMNGMNAYLDWKQTFDKLDSVRNYFIIENDRKSIISCDTLKMYINRLSGNKDNSIDKVITGIICNFIEWKNEKSDFSNILESVENSEFAEEHINRIRFSIVFHNAKIFSVVEMEKKSKEETNTINLKDVFVVHGHNETIKLEVVRTLEKLKLNPIILHEQANEGLTIIEKFEKHSEVGFAVVLLTYDDFGNSKSNEDKKKRARQNVVFELGYFIGKLGRHKVMPLYENEVELPSDMLGVVYEPLDLGGNWKFKLVKELKSAGFNVNANDIL